MNVSHVSRASMIKYLKSDNIENTLIISVNDTENEVHEIQNLFNKNNNKNNNKLLTLQILDTNEIEGFTLQSAKDIFSNVEYAFNHKLNIVVHCWAGISRSAAIAKVISDFYGVNVHTYENYRIHNKNLYNSIEKIFLQKFKKVL